MVEYKEQLGVIAYYVEKCASGMKCDGLEQY